MIIFPKNVVIDDTAIALDGGSLYLHCIDANNNEYHVTLWKDFDNKKRDHHIPGRLYINKFLVPIRSNLEKDLLVALKNAEHNTQNLATISQVIEYVNSVEYTKNI